MNALTNSPQQKSIIVTAEERLQFRLNRTHEERYRRAMQMLRLIKKLHACKKIVSKEWNIENENDIYNKKLTGENK